MKARSNIIAITGVPSMSAHSLFLLNACLASAALILLFTFLKSMISERLRRRRQYATRREFLRFEDTHDGHSASCLRY